MTSHMCYVNGQLAEYPAPTFCTINVHTVDTQITQKGDNMELATTMLRHVQVINNRTSKVGIQYELEFVNASRTRLVKHNGNTHEPVFVTDYARDMLVYIYAVEDIVDTLTKKGII